MSRHRRSRTSASTTRVSVVAQDDFVKHFAGDIDPVQANVMYSVQQPLSASAFGDVMGTPAWRSMRTWYTVAQNDEALPPDVERQFAKRMDATGAIEVASGHLAMDSRPDQVADLVRAAAQISSQLAVKAVENTQSQQDHSGHTEATRDAGTTPRRICRYGHSVRRKAVVSWRAPQQSPLSVTYSWATGPAVRQQRRAIASTEIVPPGPTFGPPVRRNRMKGYVKQRGDPLQRRAR